MVGSGGAGKSTFADRLGALTGIPVIHLDKHYWHPGWVETSADQWRTIQSDLVGAESWIFDGNYAATFDVRFARADTVVVLAISRWVCLTRALWRNWHNRGLDVQADGCPERMDWGFFRWIWRYPVADRPRLDAALEQHHQHLQVIELCSPAQVQLFLAELAQQSSQP